MPLRTLRFGIIPIINQPMLKLLVNAKFTNLVPVDLSLVWACDIQTEVFGLDIA